MSEFDFAAQPPRREEEADAASAFAPPAAEKNSRDPQSKAQSKAKTKFKSGQEALRSDPKINADGGNATAALEGMATLLGMAGHVVPHSPAVDSPSGLVGLLKTPISGPVPTSDAQSYSLDLNQSSSAGGHISGEKTGLGTAGAGPQDAAKRDATGQAMSAIGNMSGVMGGGMAKALEASGRTVSDTMGWLTPAAKELYNFQRK